MHNSIFFRKTAIVCISGTLLITLFQGCTVKSTRKKLPNDFTIIPVASVVAESKIIFPDKVDSTATDKRSFVEFIDKAKSYCFRKEFSKADSVLRQVISLTGDSLNLFQGDSIHPFEHYISDVLFIYSTLMPDSISPPDEIVHQIFQQQMSQYFDTLEFTFEDSVVVSGLIQQTGIIYDVPVVWNERVQKALYYYITHSKGTIEHWRRRSKIYLSFMKKMFADSSLPQDLAYLPLIESGFNPKAYSRAHASGIWQFIRSTGKRYGLRSNYWIDERRDPVRSTEAAICYLKKLYEDFNHWHLALAAYNCGENGLARAINKCGTADYWQLRLPKETMNYVPLYLAALTIAKNPGFSTNDSVISDTIPFDTIMVNDCISLRDISDELDIDYDTLKKLNPHILRWCTPPDMSEVQLYVPSGYGTKFREFYAHLPDEKKVKWYRYRIQSGDNLGSIARHFRLPIESIKSVNRLHGTRIIAGKYLFIPVPVGTDDYSFPEEEKEMASVHEPVIEVPENAKHIVYEVKPGDTMWHLGELFGVSAQQIKGWNKLKNSTLQAGQIVSLYITDEKESAASTQSSSSVDDVQRSSATYVVQPGDNVYQIAKRFAMPLSEVYALNNMDPELPIIHPGDTLFINEALEPQPTSGRRNVPPNRNVLVYVVSEGDNLFRIAKNFSLSVEQIRKLNNLSSASTICVGDTIYIPQISCLEQMSSEDIFNRVVYYTVKNGDNLWRIADAFGIPVERLYEYNNLHASSVLMPGDTIRVVREREL